MDLQNLRTQNVTACPGGTRKMSIETDIDYAVQQLEAAGWKDTDGDGIREKGDLKAEFNLMYFAGDSMRQAVAMSVANQAKEKLGIAIHVEGSAPTIQLRGCSPSQ